MNNVQIDDLLTITHLDLQKSWAKNNCPEGVSLGRLNEEYKGNEKSRHAIVEKWIKLFRFSVLVGLASFIYLIWLVPRAYSVLTLIPMLTAVLPIGVVLISIQEKIRAAEAIPSGCSLTLKSFRKSVEGLNPNHRTITKYTEATVRENLVNIAFTVLVVKSSFDKCKKSEKVSVRNLVDLGNWLLKSREQFESVVKAAHEFGLTFKNADLFADAQKDLDRLDQKS